MSAAEVLADHRMDRGDDYCSCGWRMSPDTGSDIEHAAHQLDALKSAGIVVVELPKPYEEPPDTIHPYWSVSDVDGPQVVGVEDSDDTDESNWVSIQFSARWRTVDVPTARVLGAMFFAAANAAEVAS